MKTIGRRVSALLWAGIVVSCAHRSATETPAESRAAATQAPAWGEPVEDRDTEQRVADALRDLGTGAPNATALLESPVIVGPALWEGMSSVDPSLAHAGTPSTAIFNAGGTPHSLPMRTFLDAESLESLANSNALRGLSRNFSAGTIRPATAAEREVFYMLIPFEIAGKPVTVVQRGADCLLLMLEGGKLTWLDMISAYRRK